MHSHHSHSGEYVAHAVDTLDEVIEQVLFLQFDTFCLTEHMPRYHLSHLYPEEIERGYDTNSLNQNFENYYAHAQRIKQKLNSDPNCKTNILVGFETEGGLTDEYLTNALKIRQDKQIDLIVGSVHHINEIPIDYSRQVWLDAKKSCNDDMREFFKTYFDKQYNLLVALKPEVVGHFDLIRLMLTDDDLDSQGVQISSKSYIQTHWPDVWDLIIRNIDFVNSYGGLFELNSAAIRKGWDTPYPRKDIVDAILRHNGRFCFSDDSHGIKQVGLNYFKVLKFCEDVGIKEISYLNLDIEGKVIVKTISILELKSHPFWTQLLKITSPDN